MSAQVPAYQKIKERLLQQIQEGVWREGEAIPAEETLAAELGVSRMTVNRAIRELSTEQIVERVRGSGTYVAQQKYRSTLVELKNIADEIAARGHRHTSDLHLLERTKASAAIARTFGLEVGQPVFHSILVHLEDGQPIQLEDRYVNPEVAPHYMAQNFALETPNAYLIRVAPLQGVSFEIEACATPVEISDLLRMATGEPSLVLHRQTRSMGKVASCAAMWHPASRYRLTGQF